MMDKKSVTLVCFYATLSIVSLLPKMSIAGSNKKLSSNIVDRLLERKYNSGKSKINKDAVSWFSQEMSDYPGYRNPCSTESTTVKTKDLDGSGTPGVQYFPSELTQVKCSGNSLSARKKPICQIYTTGDCIDITAKIKVMKKIPSGHVMEQDVDLTVGCACMEPN